MRACAGAWRDGAVPCPGGVCAPGHAKRDGRDRSVTAACTPPPSHLPGCQLSQLASARRISNPRPPAPGLPPRSPAPLSLEPRQPRAPWRPPPALPSGRDAHAVALPPRASRPLTCGGRPAGRGRGGAGQQQGEPPGQPILAGPARSGRAGGAGGGSGRRAPWLAPSRPTALVSSSPPSRPVPLPPAQLQSPPSVRSRPSPSSSPSSLPTFFCEPRSQRAERKEKRRDSEGRSERGREIGREILRKVDTQDTGTGKSQMGRGRPGRIQAKKNHTSQTLSKKGGHIGPEGTRNSTVKCLGLSQPGPSTGVNLGLGLTRKSTDSSAAWPGGASATYPRKR